jgi:hypothetical protein
VLCRGLTTRWPKRTASRSLGPYISPMVRIGITPAAFTAISKTLPLGSVSFECEPDANGEFQIWLDAAVADWLAGMLVGRQVGRHTALAAAKARGQVLGNPRLSDACAAVNAGRVAGAEAHAAIEITARSFSASAANRCNMKGVRVRAQLGD